MIGSQQMHTRAKEVAEELRVCRQRARLTQVALATTLGVSRRTISRWESGKGQMHTIYLRRIRELGTSSEMQEVANATSE